MREMPAPMPKRPGTTFSFRSCKHHAFRSDNFLEENMLKYNHSGIPVYRPIGPILDYLPFTSDQTIGNWYRGMRKRVVHSLNYDRRMMDRFRSFVQTRLSDYPILPRVDFSHEFLDTWLENSGYTSRQKKNFHRELDAYLDNRVNKKFLYGIKSFIKREFYGEQKEPRIINGPTDMLKAVVAPYVKLMEEHVYNEHYIKHCSRADVCDRMKRIQNKFNLLYETDYSSFEGTFSVELMKACELQLFKHMLRNNHRIYKIIEHVDIGEHYFKCKFNNEEGVCKSTGSRLSGCLWTSLGNGFTNQMVIEFVKYMTQKKCKDCIDIDYLVEGDDGLIGSNLQLDWAIVGKLGLSLKCKQSHDFNELSFCGLCVGPQGLMPGSFKRVVEKFGLSTNSEIINQHNWNSTYIKIRCKELLRAKAMCLLVSNKAVPILQPLACKILELTSDVHVSTRDFSYYWEIEMQNVLNESLMPIEINMESRKFFESRYNITLNEQLRYEQMIFNMTDVHTVMSMAV